MRLGTVAQARISVQISIARKEITMPAWQRTPTKLGKLITGMAAYVTMDTLDMIVHVELA